jgi:hypothetical protein
MKLSIKRSQQDVKGMLGGHKGVSFTLSCRLILTPEEQELVQRYKLEDYPITFTNYQGTQIPDDTIGNMVVGRTQTVGDVTTLVRNEDVVKNGCDRLPILFEIVRTFGGEEVIEYPRDNG